MTFCLPKILCNAGMYFVANLLCCFMAQRAHNREAALPLLNVYVSSLLQAILMKYMKFIKAIKSRLLPQCNSITVLKEFIGS